MISLFMERFSFVLNATLTAVYFPDELAGEIIEGVTMNMVVDAQDVVVCDV